VSCADVMPWIIGLLVLVFAAFWCLTCDYSDLLDEMNELKKGEG
jgi:hypothetical protein